MPPRIPLSTLRTTCIWIAASVIASPSPVDADEGSPDRPVYAGWAFANRGEATYTDEQKADLIRSQGYAGLMGCRFESPESIRAAGAVVPGIYFGADPVKEDWPAVKQRLESGARYLSPGSGAIWLYFADRDPPLDLDQSKAIELLKRIAAWAKASGHRVALYPHTSRDEVKFYWPNVEAMSEYLRMTGLDDVSIVFTVYHEIFQGFEKSLPSRLVDALPRISVFAVAGPDLLRRDANGHSLYPDLFRILDEHHYRGAFLIYSRPYTTPANEYLADQKTVFDQLTISSNGETPE